MATSLYPQDGSFETGLPTGFVNGDPTVTQEADDPQATGTYCAQVSHTDSGEGIQFIAGGVLTPAAEYEVSFDWWHVSDDDEWSFVAYTYPEFSQGLLSANNVVVPAVKERKAFTFTAVTEGIAFYISRASASLGVMRIDEFYLGPVGGYVAPSTGNPTLRRIRNQFELRPY